MGTYTSQKQMSLPANSSWNTCEFPSITIATGEVFTRFKISKSTTLTNWDMQDCLSPRNNMSYDTYYTDKAKINCSSNFSSPTIYVRNTASQLRTTTFTLTIETNVSSYTLTTTVSPSGYGTVTAGGSMEYNSTKSLTATPGTGRYFSSWSNTAGTLSSTTSNPTTFTMGTSNATVTANFGTNSYTLTTSVSPSGGGSVTAGGSIAYGGTKSLTATPASGYSFSSWSKTAGTLSSTTTNPTTFTMGAGNATVTANFSVNSYTLTTAVSPSGAGSVTAGGTLSYGGTKSLTATANSGYTFSGWTTTSGSLSTTTSSPTTFTMGAGNATVTAVFTANNYTVTLAKSPSAGGTVTGGGTYAYGSQVSISATPASGYSFAGWTKTAGTLANANAASTTFTVPASAATVTANFSQNSGSLSMAVSPSGAGTVTGAGTYTYGSTVNISATAASGWQFSSWTKTAGTIANTSSASTTFTMPSSGSPTVTANFTKRSYAISVVSSDANKGTVTGGGTYQYQSTISISATPVQGYKFNGWTCTAGTIANASSASTTFTVPAGTATVTASFVVDAFAVSVVPSPNNRGTTTGSTTANYGSSINISASPNTGYKFTGWTCTAGTIGSASSASTTFTVPNKHATVTASFVPTEIRTPVVTRDISWSTAAGSITLTCNMINTTQVTGSKTKEPATITLCLAIIE